MSMLNHLRTLYNDLTYSDFQMVSTDENGKEQTLYLHKLIMISRPFFETYFETTIGDKHKSVMEVEDITIATILTRYIYTESTTPLTEVGHLERLIDLTHQAMMWQMFDYRDSKMIDLYNILKKMTQELPLQLLTPLYLLFGTCKEMGIPTGFGFGISSTKWSGKLLTDLLVETLISQKEKVTLDMITDLPMQERPEGSFQIHKDLMKYLDDNTFTEICVRLNAFNELILSEMYTGAIGTSRKRDLKHFRKHFDSHYKMASRYFTPKQISLIRQSQHINQPGLGALYEGNNLIVDTFQPFCARFYTYVGRLQYSESLTHPSDVKNTIHLKMDVSIRDHLYINGIAYKIVSMELAGLNEKVTDGYCGNDYHVVLQSPVEATPKLFRENVMVFKYHDYVGNNS